MAKKYNRQDLRDAAEKYKNWGKWGPNDEIGTLNYTSAEDIVAATRLVKKGKDPTTFASAIATFAARAVNSGRRLCGMEKPKRRKASRGRLAGCLGSIGHPSGPSARS